MGRAVLCGREQVDPRAQLARSHNKVPLLSTAPELHKGEARRHGQNHQLAWWCRHPLGSGAGPEGQAMGAEV